jgi:hypothetical protein
MPFDEAGAKRVLSLIEPDELAKLGVDPAGPTPWAS